MSAALAFPATNVAGNFIVVAARARFANQTFTVSDARSNVYQRALTVNNGTDDTLAIFYAENVAAGANTVTVGVSTGPASIRLAILEYAGIAQANALDGIATAAGSSTSPASGSATTTTPGDLVLGVFATQSGRTFTAGSGSTIREAVSAAPSTNLMVQDRIQATAGAITGTATMNTLDIWAAGLVAFKKASTGTNLAPTLTQPANQTSAENATISLPLVGSDPEGTTLTYSATGLPPVLSLNTATGVIAGTLTFASAGSYPVTATVSDGALTNSKTFTWTVSNVNRAPTLTQPANQTSAENATPSLPLVASDPDGTALTYSATGLPASLSVNPTTGVITGTLTSTSAGTYSVTATASDGSLTNGKTFTWTVTDVPQAPNITSLSPTSGSVGTTVTISGANFGTTQGTSSTVQFSGIPATPTSWSATQIVAAVPSGSATGLVTVTVGGIASNGVAFTVVASTPSITSLSPTSGSVGTTVTISGANFGTTQGASSAVRFNGTLATPTTWAATSIVVPVPTGATTGAVVVTVGGIASNGMSFTVGVPPPSPITLTQHAGLNTGGMSVGLAFPATNVAGNFIVVAVRARFANQTITVSDARSNVYQRALTVNNGTDDTLAIFYAENIAAGANTVTVGVSTGPASIRLAILEYAGIAQANALDGIATAAGSSTSPASGSATTTTPGDLVLGVFATQSGRTFTAGSGSTIREAVSAAPSTNLMVQDRIQATAGAITGTATMNTLDIWAAGLVAFKAASTAPATLTSQTLTSQSLAASTAGQPVGAPRTDDDYDGDGKADVTVFSPSTGTWSIRESSTGTASSATLGAAGDRPVPGDYDGDGKTDIAVYHPATGRVVSPAVEHGGAARGRLGLGWRSARAGRLRRRRQDRRRHLPPVHGRMDQSPVEQSDPADRGVGQQRRCARVRRLRRGREGRPCGLSSQHRVVAGAAVRHEHAEDRHLGERRGPPEYPATTTATARPTSRCIARPQGCGRFCSRARMPCGRSPGAAAAMSRSRVTTTATARPTSPCSARAPDSGRFCSRARTH